MSSLNDYQKRAVLCGFLDVHRRLAELEPLLVPEARPSPFSRHVSDLSPTEAKVVGDYFERIRDAMLADLRECGISLDVRPASRRWALQCGLNFVGITVDELRPEKLRGYGTLDEEGRALVLRIHDDLERLVDRVETYVRAGEGRDLARRLTRLDAASGDRAALKALERITSQHRLVEFRPAIDMIVGRMENPSFEIAVFGRVSSGKSSLLNHVAGADVLPVGVTPVTAVPTRVAYGEATTAVVSFAESTSRAIPLGELRGYASEEGNPGNGKHVTGILVRLPSRRLREGVVFVDTPGVGSLALAGAAESAAYLPRCDLGVVLVDAASTLAQEDLALVRSLYGAGVPSMVLLSKGDLLSPDDRRRVIEYTREQFRRELGVDLPVRPVSTVGADEALLDRWFDEDLAPLIERHRELAEASLGRKIARLRESVVAVLQTLLAKSRGEAGRREEGAGPGVNADAARRLLDDTDGVIRRAKQRALNWSADRTAFVESIPRAVAEALASGEGSADDQVLPHTTEGVLAERGRAAHDLVVTLRRGLAETLDALRRVAPIAEVDPTTVRDHPAAGVPIVDVVRLRSIPGPSRPWWSGFAPSLAVRVVEGAVQKRSGAEIAQAAAFYDRRLESWVKSNVARLVELYETQASAFREQLRRLAAPTGSPSSEGDSAELEADLHALQSKADGSSRSPLEPASQA